MATEISQPERKFTEILAEQKAKIDARTIKYAWVVAEVTPPRHDWDEGFQPKRTVIVSDHFETLEEAHEWQSRHRADPGSHLAVFRRRLVKQDPIWMWG